MTSVREKLSASYDLYESPLGKLYLVFTGRALTGLSFKKPSKIPCKMGSAPKKFVGELERYFHGSDKGFRQKSEFLTGTEFEKRVWMTLNDIPFGETRTYKWMAEKVGSPGAARAVGQALSKNPIPVVIPCHRVIESDGSMGGYSSGVKTKVRLLEMEYYAKMNMSSKDSK
jgi:O-6-methylguanine DNA methyltransferase